MTQDRNTAPTPLEDALEELSAEDLSVSADFLARVEADARMVQQTFAAEPQQTRGGALRGFWPGWGGFAGLAACLVLGIGLGGGFSMQIGAVGDYYLTGGVLTSDSLFSADLADVFLSEEG